MMLKGRMHFVNRASIAGAALQCGALAAFGLAGRLTVPAVVAIWVAATAVPCGVLLYAGRPELRRFDAAVAWRTLTTGLSYHLGPTSIYLLLRVDVFFLAAQASTQSVGIYSLAVSIAELTRLGTDAVSQVALSRQIGRDEGGSAAVTARATRLAALVGTASVLALLAAAPILVPAAYGRSFGAAVPLLLLLAPGALALGVSRPVSVFLLRLHSSRFVVVPSVAALGVNVALNLLLIPALGAAGCCIASSLGYLVMATVQTRLFAKTSGGGAGLLIPRRADMYALAAALRGAGARRAADPR